MLNPRVRPATPDDVREVLDLLAEAAEWAAARGHENWPERFSTRLITNAVTKGELFVAETNGEIVATVNLKWRDPFFWGENDTDAGYVHRLAVRRDHSGRGMGEVLLAWVDAQIRAHDRSWLRIDVVTSNARLRRYYEALGFVFCRDLEGEAGLKDGTRQKWQTSLYERRCSRSE